MKEGNDHAIILGGSVAGLLTARVLSDHFQQVTVIERDPTPAPGEGRRGVPQGQHIHVLLSSGVQILERLFPGFREEVVADGGLSCCMSQDWRLLFGDNEMCPFPSEMYSLQGSRPMLEGHIRARTTALPNVAMWDGCDAASLIASSPDRIEGVRVRQAEGSEQEVRAGLVVDATGRGSRTPRWLEELGYTPPEEERIGVDIRYMTRLYRPEREDFQGKTLVIIAPRPMATRGAAMMAVENGRWIVTLADYYGQHLPSDDQGFREFTESLPSPDAYHFLQTAEPVSDATPASYPASQRRRYEHMRTFPEGYLVIGDSLCSFNPVYGQGMTVAAHEATELDKCLQEGVDGLAPRFFKRAAKAVDAPWALAAGSDLRFDGVEGKRTVASRVLNWYMDNLMTVAEDDPAVAHAFLSVNNLERPPTTLMQPATAARVAKGRLRRRKAA